MNVKLSRKIEKILDTYAPNIVELKSFLEKSYDNSYVVDTEIEKEIDLNISKKLFNNGTYELRRVSNKLSQNLIELSQQILKAKEKKEIDQELNDKHTLLSIQVKILERTIYNKQQYQKKFTHPVEKNIIDHGLFSATSPNEKTLSTMRTKEGFIHFEKTGFHKLYYRNENGNLLTPFDTKTFIGLFKIWLNKGKNRVFSFRFSELNNEVSSESSGGINSILAASLNNLAKTSIIMEEYLEPNSKKRLRTKIHNPIQNADIDEENNEATIEFNNYLHESLMSGNYIPINMVLFNDLPTPTSRLLYLFVINSIKDNIHVVEIDKLIDYLSLNSSTRTKALNQIKSALQELVELEVIETYRIEKKGRISQRIYFVPSDWLKKIPEGIEETTNSPFSLFSSLG